MPQSFQPSTSSFLRCNKWLYIYHRYVSQRSRIGIFVASSSRVGKTHNIYLRLCFDSGWRPIFFACIPLSPSPPLTVNTVVKIKLSSLQSIYWNKKVWRSGELLSTINLFSRLTEMMSVHKVIFLDFYFTFLGPCFNSHGHIMVIAVVCMDMILTERSFLIAGR